MREKYFLVLDIGKTNIKIHVLDSDQHSKKVYTKKNSVINSGPYPHVNIDDIWQWVIEVLNSITRVYCIDSIVVSTHGATAVLFDPEQPNGLALPVLDYEFQGVEEFDHEYNVIRPEFYESFSPSLPGGLNIGRQLFWLEKKFARQFENVKSILLYPQYWVWRLTGQLTSECTSLGCHTDLWSPTKNRFTAFAKARGWDALFPPRVDAWEVVSQVSADVVDLTGLPKECKVHGGVHDSSASFLRFIPHYKNRDFCVMSTGTWVIGMSKGGDPLTLHQDKDMLANVDVEGELVRCIRFMGGREYSEICDFVGNPNDKPLSQARVQHLIDNDIFAVPNFSNGSGPFGKKQPEVIGHCSDGPALASLYCALMMNYCADLLNANNEIVITGSFIQNPILCEVFAQLRAGQPLKLARDTGGTVRGAALLANWPSEPNVSLDNGQASQLSGLTTYQETWLKLATTPNTDTLNEREAHQS